MTSTMPGGLEAVFVANRDKLASFLLARGAGEAADDLVQDLWLKVRDLPGGPISNPLAYLYRAANMLMIDRYRSRKRTERRDGEWLHNEGAPDGEQSPEPVGERVLGARQEIARVDETLKSLGWRRETVFRRFRIDGIAQRTIAAELGVSLSTVEGDLRIAYKALTELKEQLR